MKKTLILASLLVFAAAVPSYANQTAENTAPKKEVCCECEAQPSTLEARPPLLKVVDKENIDKQGKIKIQQSKKAEFENRLKLTDEQKAKAKAIREKGHEELQPIMEKIKTKREEIRAVKLSKIAPRAQEEKIGTIRGELKELNKKAHEIRMKNMKEFEAILTKKQVKELEKMKREGRKKFEKNFQKHHKCHCAPDCKCGCQKKPHIHPEFGRNPKFSPFHPGPVIPPTVQK